MSYATKTRTELISLCKEKGLKGYSTKKKAELIQLLSKSVKENVKKTKVTATNSEKVCRLNYIGSKFQLLDWITQSIIEKTGWLCLKDKTIADLFAGTGIVSHHFRKLGATVVSNDSELYSSIISHAFTRSSFNSVCEKALTDLQKELDDGKYLETWGFITKQYSPYDKNERKFFTVDNAQRIDYIRGRIEDLKSDISDDDYKFILASLLISADAVSNVPAVYGCYLKEFKDKAKKSLTLTPIHTATMETLGGARVYNSDVLDEKFLESFESDIVYLDPPYNERQYSKNYFPLNIIAKTPAELEKEPALKGKTGIPADCFLSQFCRRGEVAEGAFNILIGGLKTKWIFLSYNSESIVSKKKMIEIMEKYGEVSVVERDYKRFKSFEYNKDVAIKEYLFCLRKL